MRPSVVNRTLARRVSTFGWVPRKVAWKFATGGRVESGPALHGDNVFIASCDGKLYCIDVATGKAVWNYATQPNDAGRGPIYSVPIVSEDAVCFAAGEGQVYALTRTTGRLLWKFRPSEESELFTSPATDGQRVFVTSRPAADGAGEASVVAIGAKGR